jgi:ParB-like chromosome segregation protein Spo0J
MIIREVPLSAIEFEDETFRISEDLGLERMIASLRAVGQVHPVLLLERAISEPSEIVCGFRRLHGLRALGKAGAFARILNAAEFTTLEVFLRAIWDNLAQRPLNPLESARVLFTLRQKCGVKDQALIEQFLPLLGLSPHRNVLQSYLGLHQLHAELRRLVKEGHLTLASAERLSREAPDAQARVAPVWSSIRLTASLQRELLDLAEDLAAISGATPSGVLADPEILSITRDAGLSGYQKGQKIHDLLYRRRNPRLSMARDAFLAEKSRLNLPGSVRLSPDPFFERPRLRVEFDVNSARAFRETVAALDLACRAPSLDRLFQI